MSGAPATAWDLVLFDLDGTLVETAPEIADAVNDTLLRFQLPACPQAQVEAWIGHGTRELLVQALASATGTSVAMVRASDILPAVTEVFDQNYFNRSGTRSRPYPGALELLHGLRERRTHRALVTNKEARHTDRLLAAHRLEALFSVVVSGDTLATKKPDPGGVLHCVQACGADAGRTLFIGDSSIDVATARRAGIPVWVLTHGYNMGEPIEASGPDRVFGSFEALGAALLAGPQWHRQR